MEWTWNGKRVVVTGGAGMIGGELVRLLLDAGASVVVLDNFSRGNRRIDGAEYAYGDAGNEGVCRDVLKGADAVFNLAAEVAGVEFNQSHQFWMFWRNIRVLMMPLRIAAEYGVKRFLQTSSVCIYAPEYNHPCREENGLIGVPTKENRGYSLAKRMGEYMAKWCAEEGLHTVIVRPSNVYGPYDYFDERAHVIPALIRKTVEDEEIIVNGSGKERREFIYSTDVAHGMMAALARGRPGQVYNLGTDGHTCVSIKELAEMIRRIVGVDKPIVFKRMFSGGDEARWSDCTKAYEELGWRASIGLEEGLRRVVRWYLAQGREG